jgi:uncharacterized protein YbcV (DUF1398 family)
MDAAISHVVRECSRASDEDRENFAAIVGRLIEAGIERYHADLVRSEKTFYLPNGESETVPNRAIKVTPALSFSPAGVEAAVRAAQAGTIAYRTFCERALASGCVGYHVSIAGRRVIYYGRSGDSHVEWFPGAKS